MLKRAVLGIAMLLVPCAARAQDSDACNPYAPIPVAITPVFEEPKLDFDASLADIQTMVRDQRHSIHESIAMGITQYEPMLEFRLPVKTVTYPDGTTCAHVERADVTIGYKNVTVRIAREIPQGSCGFGEIMAHEQKHIAVNRRILDEYTGVIQQKLSDYLKLNGTFREPNPDYVARLLHEKLQVILNDLGEQMMKENRDRQQAVDTLAEYRRITASCNGQLAVIATHSRGNYP